MVFVGPTFINETIINKAIVTNISRQPGVFFQAQIKLCEQIISTLSLHSRIKLFDILGNMLLHFHCVLIVEVFF